MIKIGIGLRLFKTVGKGLLMKAGIGSSFALYRLPTPTRTLFLTFDDGPHPENTPAILDALRRYDAHATFFLIGEQVEQYPTLARRIRAEGHSVGSHTHTHIDLSKSDTGKIELELDRSRLAIEEATGESVTLFRSPWGKIGWRGLLAVRRKRLRHILWSVDSMDYRWTDPEEIARRIRETKFSPGDILLFHDDYAHTVRALPEILDHLTSQGWRLEALRNVSEDRLSVPS